MTEDGKRHEELDSDIPLLPLKDIVVFPNMIVPVFINEDLCINAVEEALAHDGKIFLSAFKENGFDGEGLQSHLEPPFDVYDVGTICSIMRTRKLPDGRMKVLVQGFSKATVEKLSQEEPFPAVKVRQVSDPSIANHSSELEALIRSVRESLEKVVARHGSHVVHPYDDPRIIAGQGTVGLELLEQLENFDVVVVPVGGGGLLAGVATAIKARRPEVEVM